jgi:hypothetical protein
MQFEFRDGLSSGVILTEAVLQAEGRISRGARGAFKEDPREIPRPADENAELRDDAIEMFLGTRS